MHALLPPASRFVNKLMNHHVMCDQHVGAVHLSCASSMRKDPPVHISRGGQGRRVKANESEQEAPQGARSQTIRKHAATHGSPCVMGVVGEDVTVTCFECSP